MHLIQQNQFAFVINFSTTTAFIRTVDSWKLAIDKEEKVICDFLDLQKSFDVIDHATLLDKMQAYGVRATALEWIGAICLKELS